MKKYLITTTVALALSKSLFAFDYQIVNGPNLLGAVEEISDFTIFNNKCVEYIYYQDFTKLPDIEWKYRNVNSAFTEIGTELDYIEKGKGFFIEAVGNCSVTVDENFLFKGFNYGTVTSPTTGHVWLDRNLGASRVCDKARSEFSTDLEYENSQSGCFGDYYQWGRYSDGHQLKDSTSTTTRSSSVTTTNSYFVKSTSATYHYDWATPDDSGSIRSANWLKTNETSICPSGFRVPTISELEAEASNLSTFITTLNLPYAGKRDGSTANLYYKGYVGYLWSATPSNQYSKRLVFDDNGYNTTVVDVRALGYNVRCIKDY